MIKALFNNNSLAVLNTSDKLEDGKEYLLEIKKPTRTVKQNALLWVYFQIIADFTGDSKESVHDDVLDHLKKYKEEANTKTGEVRQRRMKTSEMTIGEMITLIDEIVLEYGIMYGLEFPTPEEYFSNIK